MSEERMIEARDAFYAGLDKGEPCHWRDVGPGEIWDAAWRAAWNLRQQVPEGWALVPKEPDGEMWSAGRREFNKQLDKHAAADTFDAASAVADCAVDEIWRSMLSAAPRPEDVK